MPKQAKSAKLALIGATLEVLEARNPALNGIRGKIIDETRNTITVKTERGTKTIIKEQTVLKIGDRTIDGKKLIGKIAERIKQ